MKASISKKGQLNREDLMFPSIFFVEQCQISTVILYSAAMTQHVLIFRVEMTAPHGNSS